MSPRIGQLYEFANFRLDSSQKVLLRDGKPIALTPKVFDTLEVLLENAGQLLEKDELMLKIWDDHFVEEGNLTANVKMLRKALGDNAAEPQFIETVPRRGYRFIAEVTKNGNSVGEVSSQRDSSGSLEFKKYLLLPSLAVLMVGAVLAGFWYSRAPSSGRDAPVLSAPFSSEKLSTNGKVLAAVISPDGKTVVYTNGLGSDKQSIWLRQLESSNNVEIIPPSDVIYFGLALSPDGNFLYFSRRSKGAEQADIYRVSIFGGIPTKIASETQGSISVSADGAKISFRRCYYRDDEFCSLWIADAADGRNERKIISRPRPIRIGDNDISPDGQSIAFAAGQSENAANEFGLFEVNIESGVEREMTAQKFFNIKHLEWLPDGGRLLLTASQIPNKNFRIWQVSSTTGDVEPLTKDSESYSALSLNKDASRLVSTQVKQDFHLRLLNMENPSAERILANGAAVAFARDGKIIFQSPMSGNDEIWSINPDGSGQRQLTSHAADEGKAIGSPADNSIFFASNRTGEAHVWRMNSDGSNQTQITQKEGGYPLFASHDGRWLYYQHGINRTLWRVAAKGGGEQLVLNKAKRGFAFSPDGSSVAFWEKQGAENFVRIASLDDGGQTINTLKLPDPEARVLHTAFLPDGKSLAYILADSENMNNTLWLHPLDGGTPKQIADLGDEEIADSGFALAPDGKSFIIAQGGWRHDAILMSGLR